MTGARSAGLVRVLRVGPYRNLWLGTTVSILGDGMTRTALTWYVLRVTGSPLAVGLLVFAYAAPVAVGGFVAGHLLDRFDRRRMMLMDSVLRGVCVASVPVASTLGHLALAQVYVVAAMFGLLFMIGLAGTPSLIPTLVDRESLTAANSLDALSFPVGSVAGPALAGLLIAAIGAPDVLLLDAASYGLLALALASLPAGPAEERAAVASPASGLAGAVRLVRGSPVLLATTLMFMSFNAGQGIVAVWLPVDVARMSPDGGAQLYGLLLALVAIGSAAGTMLAGSISPPLPLGRLICLGQALSGLGLALALFGGAVPLTGLAMVLYGFFSGPTTPWAQTLRMRTIPPELRGRAFALLRTAMVSSIPAFGALGGVLLPLIGLPAMIALSVGLVAAPGLAGSQVRQLGEESA